ncbi:hypothetical protein R6Q57_018214 [Mikania cordata]
MVAIAVYKGSLHRAPNTPRQWLTPTRKISPKDFQTLIHRRSRALARLQSTQATTSNPNPNPQSNGSLEFIVNDVSTFKDDHLLNSNADGNGNKGSTGDDDAWLVVPADQLLAADAKPDLPENGTNDAMNGLQEEHHLEVHVYLLISHILVS